MDNVDYSRINLSDVERIEIVRGASSALYGSAATGGVVNIITRQNLKSSYNNDVSARWARHNSRRFDLNLGHNLGQFTHLFNMQHQAQAGYSLKNPENVALFTTYALNCVPGHRVWQWKDRWVWAPSADFRITARAGYFFRQQDFDATQANRYRDFVGSAKAEWNITPETRMELAYNFDQYDKSDFLHDFSTDIRDYSNVQHTTRFLVSHDFDHLLPSDLGFTLTTGGDYQRDYLMSYQFQGGSHVQHSADAFVQADWTLATLGNPRSCALRPLLTRAARAPHLQGVGTLSPRCFHLSRRLRPRISRSFAQRTLHALPHQWTFRAAWQ